MNPTSAHPFSRYASIIDDWEAFANRLQQTLPRSLWLNPLKPINPAVKSALTQPWEAAPHWPESYLFAQTDLGTHWGYYAGLYHIQETVSMLPALLLRPQPGERILDLCAAPGSKTVQLALAMQNQGTLIANDKNYMRTKALRYHLERLGITNVATTTCDGASYPKAVGLFDKILVDAPCSGEGTSRKQSQKWLNNLQVHNVHRLQQRLLSRAVSLCKPGGLIVYSTCTYAPEENEQVINTALQQHPELSLLPISFPHLLTTPGITVWEGQHFSEELVKTARVWPHHNDTGGFYLALMQKTNHVTAQSDELPIAQDTDSLQELQQYLQPFAFPPDMFKQYATFKVAKHGIYVVSADHVPVNIPNLDAMGLFVLKSHMQHPKLTTAGAKLWGHLAQQQFVELDTSQLQAYLRREDINLPVGQTENCTHGGYVIVRHEGLGLGVGLLMNPILPGTWMLRSLYPKT
ncbi:MAG: RsmB/NOP family class I SAM-dependent RNA methyltransferase [Gammaproteobacteria bacterium]